MLVLNLQGDWFVLQNSSGIYDIIPDVSRETVSIWTVQIHIEEYAILGVLSLNGDVSCYVYDSISI